MGQKLLRNVLFQVFIFIMFMSILVCVAYVHVCGYTWGPEDIIRSSGAGVSDGCESPDPGAGSRTLETQQRPFPVESTLQPYETLRSLQHTYEINISSCSLGRIC